MNSRSDGYPFIPMLVPAIVATLGGCESQPTATGAVPVQIEDSAGVRIVEYAGKPDIEAPFRFLAEPRYRHGTNPSDYAFQRMSAGRLLPDGSAVVADAFATEVIVLTADGTTYDLLAGPGEGPGDVSYVNAIFALGRDSIWVSDPFDDRLTLFARGSVARTVDIRRADGLGADGIGSSGHLLMSTSSFISGFEVEWLPGHMARFDMETGAVDTVASYDYVSRAPQGLRWDPIGALGSVAVAAGQFVYARSDKPEVIWRQPDGTVTQIVRWQAEAVLLTEALLEGIEAGMREGNSVGENGLTT